MTESSCLTLCRSIPLISLLSILYLCPCEFSEVYFEWVENESIVRVLYPSKQPSLSVICSCFDFFCSLSLDFKSIYKQIFDISIDLVFFIWSKNRSSNFDSSECTLRYPDITESLDMTISSNDYFLTGVWSSELSGWSERSTRLLLAVLTDDFWD